MHKYQLRYEFESETRPEGYTKDELGSKGGCDAFLGISIIKPEDGSYSQACVVNIDGAENRSLTQEEIFKIWMMLGLSLYDQGKLEGWKHQLTELHSQAVRLAFKSFAV